MDDPTPASARLKGALRTMVDFDCPACNTGAAAQVVAEDHIACSACSTTRSFRRGQLVVVTGSPATGKSSVGRALAIRLPPHLIVLDSDLTARPQHDLSLQAWLGFIDTWLRTAVGIAQNGHTLVLVGYSTPEQWEHQALRHFLGPITHIALVCSSHELDRRLRQRPWMDPLEFESLIELNERFRSRRDVTMVETDKHDPEEVADELVGLLNQASPSRPLSPSTPTNPELTIDRRS